MTTILTKVKKHLMKATDFKCLLRKQKKVKVAVCNYIKANKLIYNSEILSNDQILINFANKYIRPTNNIKKSTGESYIEKARRFYKSDEWRRLRYEVLREQKGKCQCCGRSAKDGVVLHVDHIIPLSKDWSKRLDKNNLQVLCEDCNLGKSNTDSIDWRRGFF